MCEYACLCVHTALLNRESRSLSRPPPRWDYVAARASVAFQGAWSGIRPAESGMKGGSCWDPGKVRSLCNSGCLSKLNQGQYSDGESCSTGARSCPILSVCPMTKPSSSCHLLLIVCLRGSCHSSIHLSPYVASVICRRGCSHFCSLL